MMCWIYSHSELAIQLLLINLFAIVAASFPYSELSPPALIPHHNFYKHNLTWGKFYSWIAVISMEMMFVIVKYVNRNNNWSILGWILLWFSSIWTIRIHEGTKNYCVIILYPFVYFKFEFLYKIQSTKTFHLA